MFSPRAPCKARRGGREREKDSRNQTHKHTHTHTQKKPAAASSSQQQPAAASSSQQQPAAASKTARPRAERDPTPPSVFPQGARERAGGKRRQKSAHTHTQAQRCGVEGGSSNRERQRETERDRERQRETERDREKERGKQPRGQKFVRGPRLGPPVYYTGGRKMESKGEQTAETQDELQWIVAQRLLSTLTIPGFD